MPNLYQVQVHNQQQQELADEAARREAAAREQIAAQQAEQQRIAASLQGQRDYALAGYNADATARQAGYQTQRDQTLIGAQQARDYNQFAYGQADRVQQFGQQQQLMQQQAGNEWNARIQQKDLAGELQQIQLTQTENMRIKRMKEQIAAVKANRNLMDYEKADYITQIETDLNPLLHRQQRANILQTQIQSQGMEQQIQHREVLFGQQQEYRANALNGRLPTLQLQLPNGESVHGYIDQNGNPQVLDTSWAQQGREVGMAGQLLQLGQGIENLNFSRQANPLTLQGMQLRNEFTSGMNPIQIATAAHNLQLSQATAPAVVQHALLTNDRLAQQISQSADMHPQNMQLLNAQIDSLLDANSFNRLSRPERLNILRADAALRTFQAADADPQSPMGQARLRYQQAHADVTAAQARELNDPVRIEAERAYTQARTELLQAQASAATYINERRDEPPRSQIVYNPDSQAAANRAADQAVQNNEILDAPDVRREFANRWLQENGHGNMFIQQPGGNWIHAGPRTPPPPPWTPQVAQRVTNNARHTIDTQLATFRSAVNRATTAEQRLAVPLPSWISNGDPRDPNTGHINVQWNHYIQRMRDAAIQEEVDHQFSLNENLRGGGNAGIGGGQGGPGGGQLNAPPAGAPAAPGGQPQGAMPPPAQRNEADAAAAMGLPRPIVPGQVAGEQAQAQNAQREIAIATILERRPNWTRAQAERWLATPEGQRNYPILSNAWINRLFGAGNSGTASLPTNPPS